MVPNDSKDVADVFIKALLDYVFPDNTPRRDEKSDDPSKRVPRLLEILKENISGMSNGMEESYTNAYNGLKEYFDTGQSNKSLLEPVREVVGQDYFSGLNGKSRRN